MTRPRKRLLVVIAAVVALPLAGYAAAQDYFEAAAFVVRAAGMQGLARSAAALEAEAVTAADLTIPWRDGELRARTYTPADITGRPILLVPGVHAAGIAEPRLIAFATRTCRHRPSGGHRAAARSRCGTRSRRARPT